MPDKKDSKIELKINDGLILATTTKETKMSIHHNNRNDKQRTVIIIVTGSSLEDRNRVADYLDKKHFEFNP